MSNKSAMEKALQYQENDVVECPFDKSHKVPRNRLQVHLSTCRLRNSKNFETCPFNALHIMEPSLLSRHIENCPNRSGFENFCYGETLTNSASKAPEVPRIQSEESWDELPDTPAYNPREEIQNKVVLRCPTGLSRAGRRQFREQERIRLMSIQNRNKKT